MAIKLKKNMSDEEIDKEFSCQSKVEAIKNYKNVLKKYEDKFDMSSSNFYKLYSKNKLDYNIEYQKWKMRIDIYCKYRDIEPKKINLNRG